MEAGLCTLKTSPPATSSWAAASKLIQISFQNFGQMLHWQRSVSSLSLISNSSLQILNNSKLIYITEVLYERSGDKPAQK